LLALLLLATVIGSLMILIALGLHVEQIVRHTRAGAENVATIEPEKADSDYSGATDELRSLS
jgi:hypothetical protein